MHLVHELRNRLLVRLPDCEACQVLSIFHIHQGINVHVFDVLESAKHDFTVVVLCVGERISDCFQSNASVSDFDSFLFLFLDEFVDLLSNRLPS